MNNETFGKIEAKNDFLAIKEKDGSMKFFVAYETGKSPERLKYIMDANTLEVKRNNKSYTPIFVGADEAKMMIKKELIRGAIDTIDGLFGNDIYVAKILPRTNTMRDMMHIVPREIIEKARAKI
jgi:hypothetical protein